MDLKTVSKAIAGALMAVIGGLLIKYQINLPPEFSGALEVVLDTIILAGLGYVGVWASPANKVVKGKK